MPAIASVFVEVLPETSKVADGIKRVFRELDSDASEAGRRWGNEIQRSIGKVKVDVDADTAKASAQIDAMSRDRKATVEVDADTLGSSVQRGISQGGQAGIGALQPALMGIGVTMAAGVASALSGLAALIPAGIAGAGGVIGTLALGLDGVKDAWDAAGKAAQSSGTDQAAKAKEVASAQRSLRDAVQSEQQAQKDVATARKDALHQLRDLNLELHGGALDEKQAILDAQAARRDLATGRFKDSIEYQQAQLRVQEADQRVAEAHQRNIDLQTKATDERRKGVDGADQVVAANQRLAKSQEQVATAQDNLNQVSSKQSSSATALSQAMANLSPNAQAFLEAMRGIKPIFDQLKFSVQDSLLAGLGPVIQNLATTYLPILQQGLGSLASTMNQAFGQFAAFMTQPQTMAAMQGIFANIGSSFQIWAQSLQPVSQAFLTLTQVGSSFLPQLAQMMVNAGNAFNQFISQAAQSGQLQQWIQTGITALGQLGQMLSTLGPMFLQLAPIGTATLGAINQLLTSLAPAIAPLAGLFASMITEMTPGLGILGQIVSTLIQGLAPAFTMVFQAMAPFAQQMASILGPVLAQLAPVLAQMSAQLGQQLASAIQQLMPQLIPLAEQFAKLLQDVIPLMPQLMNFGQSVLPLITTVLSAMTPQTTKMIEWIDKLVEKVPGLVSPLLGLANALDSIGNKVSWLIGPLGKLLSLVPGSSGAPSTPYPAGINPIVPGAGPQPNLIAGGVQINDVIGTPGSHREHQGLPPLAPVSGSSDLASALQQAGIDPVMIPALLSFAKVEGNNPAGVPTLGFTDSQAGSTLQGHVQALAQQIQSRKSVTGPFPSAGSPAEQAAWIANLVGQNGVVDWQGNQQPSRSDYISRIASGMGGAMPGISSSAGLSLPDVRGAHPQLASALAAIQQLFPGLVLTAGETDHPKDGGWHPKGQAIDIGGGTPQQQAALANWLTQFAPDIEEMIHKGPGVTQNIKSGKLGPAIDMPGSVYSTAQAGDHSDHVHLAVTDQMAQAFMAAMNGGTAPGMTGPTGAQNDPYYMQYPQGYKPPGPDLGQFGQTIGGDIWDSILPEGFKNPTQFGGVKFLTGLLGGFLGMSGGGGKGGGMPGWMWGAAGGDGASLPTGGGDVLGSLLSNVPQAFGALKVGTGPDSAPGQFMPTMPDYSGGATPNIPGDVMSSQANTANGAQGNQIDNRIDMRGMQIGSNAKDIMQQVDAKQNARARQPLRALPGQG